VTRDEFEEVKRYHSEISLHLREGNLTLEERLTFENLKVQLAGQLVSNWLPFGLVRRAAMISLFLFGLLFFADWNFYFLIAWLFMLCFSPRFVGEFGYFVGQFLALIRSDKSR